MCSLSNIPMPRSVTSSSTAEAQDTVIAQLLHTDFYRNLSESHRRLIRTSITLYLEERRVGLRYPDYGFVVFGIAKGYEGFLKEYLLRIGLLSNDGYFDRGFRIGRALNPDVSANQRDRFWLYDDLMRHCSAQVARQIWDAWLECRNQVFHYFPGKDQPMTLLQAGEKIVQLAEAMQAAYDCELPK